MAIRVVVSLLVVLVAALPSAAQTTAPSTLTVEPAVHGYVTATGIDCGAGRSDCAETFAVTTTVTLTPTANPGYVFLGWAGDCSGDATAQVVVDQPRLCIPVFNSATGGGPEAPSYAAGAVFLDVPATLSTPRRRVVYLPPLVDVRVAGGFAVTVSLHSATAGELGAVTFTPVDGGSLVAGDYPFATGSPPGVLPGLVSDFCASAEGGRFRIHELTRDGLAILTLAADFEVPCEDGGLLTGSIRHASSHPSLLPFGGEPPQHRVRAEPGLGGRITGSGLNCGSGQTVCEVSFNAETTLGLTATPDPGYEFLAWGDGCMGDTATTTVAVRGSRVCRVFFHPVPGSAAAPDPAFATSLFLYAPDADAENRRRIWTQTSGRFFVAANTRSILFEAFGESGTLDPPWVLMEVPALGTAGFAVGEYETTFASPNGNFPRLSLGFCSPATGRFRVHEVATAPDGTLSSFAIDFEFRCRADSGPVYGAVRFNSTRPVVRPFNGAFPDYTLTIDPSINGTVAGTGLSCGPGVSDCTETYGSSSVVTLVATPSPGYVFVGWRGACDGGPTTSLRVDFPTRCQAIFNASPPGSAPEDPAIGAGSFFVDSEIGDPVGQGQRHVWTSDAVITASAASRSHVQLTVAEPDNDQWRLEFRAPGGADLAVRAYEGALRPFAGSPYAGFRIEAVGRQFCFEPLSTVRIHEVAFDEQPSGITLVAFAADFVQHCSDDAPPLRGAIRYRSTRATLQPFSGETPSFTLHIVPPAHGAIVASGLICGSTYADCVEDYGNATTVTLEAKSQPGYVFTGWTGACVGTSTTITINLQIAKSCSAEFAVSAPPRLQAAVQTSGLTNPVAMVVDPTDQARLLIAEQDGRIRVSRSGVLQAEDFLDLRGIVSTLGGEGGVLGFALPSNYGATGRFFVSYTNAAGDIVVSRFRRASGSAAVADPATRVDLAWSTGLRHIAHPFMNGYAAGLAFGPDGHLYVALSDGGGGDPYHLAQSGNNLLGKILRLDVNVADLDFEGFDVPADNPFLDAPGTQPEVWAFGLRQPRHLTFDPTSRGGTGALVVVDRGATRWEEINYEPAGSGGRNYGWRNFEGAQPRAAAEPLAFGPPTSPVFEYGRPDGSAITGGFVFRGITGGLGAQYGGRYFFADFNAGRVWSIALAPSAATGEAIAGDLREHTADLSVPEGLGTISAVVTSGEAIYLLSQSTGRVIRVTNRFSTTMPAWTAAPAADMNGDARLDLIWQHATQGYVAAWLLNGTTLGDSVLTNPSVVNDTNWKIVATPRLNADFNTDLVWQDDREGWLGAWLMNGRELLESVSLTPSRVADTNWKIVGSADLNRDGKMDLIWRHLTEGWLAAWLMDGTTMVDSVLLSPDRLTDQNWKIVGFGDFNRDGHADILWWNSAEGWLVAWDMVGTRMVGSVSLVPERVADVDWVPVSVADANEDGSPDIIWQHRKQGWLAVWLMNGRTLLTSTSLTPDRVADVNWRIVGPK